MLLEGKNALVTGGSQGIGAAASLELAREGANVCLTYRKHDVEAKQYADEIREMGRKALAVKCDISSFAEAESVVKKAVDEFGGLDILVNNAGMNWDGVSWKMSEEQWDRILNIHLKGTFTCSQAAARHMKEQKSGKIINVISTAGLFGTVGQINYASAKAGIIGFTKSASRELGRYNINVNAISCGVIKTDMTQKVQSDPKLSEIYTKRIQLGRFGEPDEVALSFVFLASSESDYITGQVLPVDGGYIG